MRRHEKYGGLSEEEVISFFNSLDKEKDTFRLSLNDLLNSEIIIGEKIDDKIAGIVGIRKHKMLPLLFIVVRSEFQGRGVGKELMERLHEIAKRKYSFIVLSVSKKNKHAINLFKKFGYEVFGDREECYYMTYPVSITGRINSKILVLFHIIIKFLRH